MKITGCLILLPSILWKFLFYFSNSNYYIDFFFIPKHDRLETGMDKITEARVQLHDLNQKLDHQKIEIAKQTAACEKLIIEIDKGILLKYLIV